MIDPEVFSLAGLVSLVTLTVMEVVLGIDNIVFISVIVGRLDPERAKRARQFGLLAALVFRVVLLMAIAWIIGLKAPLFHAFGQDFSWRDLILAAGGLFLLYKATHEIHNEIEGAEPDATTKVTAVFAAIIAQIVVIDLVFSVDSIITAIGMADHVEIMIAAVVISMAVMYVASGPIAEFIKQHPTTKMLALSFLVLIGVALIADGLGFHIPRGYIYFAMAFSALVEIINITVRARRA